MKTSPLVGCYLPFRIAGCTDNDADSVADVNDLFDLKGIVHNFFIFGQISYFE